MLVSCFEFYVMQFFVPFASLWDFESVDKKLVWSVFLFPSTCLFDSHDPMHDYSKWTLTCLHINMLSTSHCEFHSSWPPVPGTSFLAHAFHFSFIFILYRNHTWILKKKNLNMTSLVFSQSGPDNVFFTQNGFFLDNSLRDTRIIHWCFPYPQIHPAFTDYSLPL